jgi:transposase InsO family protein
MWRMAATLVDLFIESFGKPPEELILDFDASDDPVHGNQEERFFHGYYDCYCFLPLYVFCGERLLCAYLRPSNIDAARHAWAILALLEKKLRAAWPGVRLVIRADSGFCRWRMLRWCERHDVAYIVGLARNSRLLEAASRWIQPAAEAFARGGEKQRLFGEFMYAAGTWDHDRRVIVKAEHLPGGDGGKANTRFIVTNLPGDGADLYERVYCARGEMENRVKEQQLGLFSDRTSCHAFAANQFRVLLSAAASALVEHVRRVGLHGTDLARAQATRLRLELFKIGARVTISVRRIVVHLAEAYPHRELFALAAGRLMAPS